MLTNWLVVGIPQAASEVESEALEEATGYLVRAAEAGSLDAFQQQAVELDAGGQYHEAAELYRKAAEGGLAVAQHNLAMAYWTGEGVARDAAEAVRWVWVDAHPWGVCNQQQRRPCSTTNSVV